MKEMKVNNYTQNRRLFCDWTDRMYYSFHYRMLKNFCKTWNDTDKIYETISIKESKWLEKSKKLHTQNKNQAKQAFKEDVHKLLNKCILWESNQKC